MIVENFPKLESNLMESADQMLANSKLTAAKYHQLVLSLIYLLDVKEAHENHSPPALEITLQAWEPLVSIEYDPMHKGCSLYGHSGMVDKIEKGVCATMPLNRPQEVFPAQRRMSVLERDFALSAAPTFRAIRTVD